MKNLFYSIFAFSAIVFFCSCDKDDVEKNASIIGTWKLISVTTPEGIETGDEGVSEFFYFGEDGNGYYQVIDDRYDDKDHFRYERVENTLTLDYTSRVRIFSITKLNKSELSLYYTDKEDDWSETWNFKKE